MPTTITLDERHYTRAVKKARDLGTTTEDYIHSLIDAAALNFDEILAPVREGFAKTATTEDELDDIVTTARKAIFQQSQRDDAV